MIKITFTRVDLSTGKTRRCTRKINRSEFLSWMDKEGQIEIVNGCIVRLIDLKKHIMIQAV